jgi:transposase InsO family protein
MSERKRTIEFISDAAKAGARRSEACKIVGINNRTLQRWTKDLRDDGRKNNRIPVSNTLSSKEKRNVIDLVCSREYRDLSPNQIVPILAENGQYLASESTMYRILKREGLQKHRSRSKAPERSKPDELIATGPNQVWTWDISYLRTYSRGSFFYLYLILDIWDRSVVGWAIHESESGPLAADLLRESCMSQGVDRNILTVHQDNGAAMISSEFLSELGLWGRPSYSRPGVSDDNPYSEAMFRTVKYRPGYPEAFKNMEDANVWMRDFIQWYNNEHRHSGIGFVTPMQKRRGEDVEIMEMRKATYFAARNKHPERWSGDIRRWEITKEVALNPKSRKKGRQSEAA